MLIDMHSHILPLADHGSDSVETSLQQIKKAREAGIKVIVATPHFYLHNDNIPDFIERREVSYNKLMQALDKDTRENIRIIKGAEVMLEIGLAQEEQLPKLCIEGTNNILIELPTEISWTDWIYKSIFYIGAKYRVHPLIAHIDRYEKEQLYKLLEMGVKTQINANSLVDFHTRKWIMHLVKAGRVDLLGSDVHGKDAIEYKYYKTAIKKLGPYADEIMENAMDTINLKKYDTDKELVI